MARKGRQHRNAVKSAVMFFMPVSPSSSSTNSQHMLVACCRWEFTTTSPADRLGDRPVRQRIGSPNDQFANW
eukprot:15473054-Alexandrium_andersonii.AAC.1